MKIIDNSENSGRTARRPRGSRKAAQVAAAAGMMHADMVGAAADRPQFNRSFSDYAQQMQYKLSTCKRSLLIYISYASKKL